MEEQHSNNITLNKGDIVYYARIFPSLDIFEVIDLKIRTVENNYFVGTEKRTKRAYLFNNNKINKIIYLNRNEALNITKDAEKNSVKHHFHTDDTN